MARRIINIVVQKNGVDRKHSFIENQYQREKFNEIIDSEQQGEQGICMRRIHEIQDMLTNNGFTIRVSGLSFQ